MSAPDRPTAEETLQAIFAAIGDWMAPNREVEDQDVIVIITELLERHGMKFGVDEREPRDEKTFEHLSDDQIALLCRIGESDLAVVPDSKIRDLEWLISAGYAEPTEGDPGSDFRLTAKAHEFLEKRGVGLNEA